MTNYAIKITKLIRDYSHAIPIFKILTFIANKLKQKILFLNNDEYNDGGHILFLTT